jgi:hypothetical protein
MYKKVRVKGEKHAGMTFQFLLPGSVPIPD